MRDGPETAALDEDGALVEFLGRLNNLSIGAEHGSAPQPLRDELQAHEAVVHLGESRTAETDHVDLDAFGREVVEQAADEFFRLGMQAECAVDQIDADDAERFLLGDIFRIEHADVDDDFTDRTARIRLEADPHPTVRFTVTAVTARGNSIGKNKKCFLRAHFLVETLAEEGEFVLEHAAQAFATDVALHRPVDGIAERHVISRHGLGHRAGGCADIEKATRHLLARADFGKGAVNFAVEVQFQRLAVDREIEIVDRHKAADCAPSHPWRQRESGLRALGACQRRGAP